MLCYNVIIQVVLASAGPAEDEAGIALEDGTRDRGTAEDHQPQRRGHLHPGSGGPEAAQSDADGVLPVQHELSAMSRDGNQRAGLSSAYWKLDVAVSAAYKRRYRWRKMPGLERFENGPIYSVYGSWCELYRL